MLKLKKIPIKESKWQKEHGLNVPEVEDNMLNFPPSFSANEKQIPEIVDWKVGEKYKIVLEIEMKRMSSYDNGTKKNTDASFDVKAYQVLDEDYDNMSDDDIEAMQGKALSKK